MKTEIKNHGIIRSEKREIKFPCTQSEFEEFDKYFQENPCDLNSGLDSFTKIAAKELDKNNISSEWPEVLSELRKQEECSPAWYAAEIIICAHCVREQVANNNAEDAAYMMGLLVQHAWHWNLRSHEKGIFSGIKLSSGGKNSKRGSKHNWDKVGEIALTIQEYYPFVPGKQSEFARKVDREYEKIYGKKTGASTQTIVLELKKLIK